MGIAWREQLSVSNDVIDNDHKYLIDIINQVEKHVAERNRDGLTENFEKLVEYSLLHFAVEEKIALAVGYPQTDSLGISHKKLIENLRQSKDDLNQGWTPATQGWTKESVDSFTQLLRDWLINHIIKEDLLMKPYLKKFSPKFDPR